MSRGSSQCWPRTDSSELAPLRPEQRTPVSNGTTWLQSHRQEKYVTVLGVTTICVPCILLCHALTSFRAYFS